MLKGDWPGVSLLYQERDTTDFAIPYLKIKMLTSFSMIMRVDFVSLDHVMV